VLAVIALTIGFLLGSAVTFLVLLIAAIVMDHDPIDKEKKRPSVTIAAPRDPSENLFSVSTKETYH
jgi:hypothetical protein